MSADVDDTSADSIVDEAIGLRDRGQEAEAIALLNKVLEEHPNSSAAHAILGGLRWDYQDLEGARRCFAEAVRLSPKMELASLGLFHTSYKLGDKDAAFGEMRRFLSISESVEYRKLIREFKKMGEDQHDDS